MDYSEYEGKTVLVTGGAGCVGSNLTRKLAELAEKVIILDNLSSAYEWNIPTADNIQFVEGDILNDEELKRVFKEQPDMEIIRYVVKFLPKFLSSRFLVASHPTNDFFPFGWSRRKKLVNLWHGWYRHVLLWRPLEIRLTSVGEGKRVLRPLSLAAHPCGASHHRGHRHDILGITHHQRGKLPEAPHRHRNRHRRRGCRLAL